MPQDTSTDTESSSDDSSVGSGEYRDDNNDCSSPKSSSNNDDHPRKFPAVESEKQRKRLAKRAKMQAALLACLRGMPVSTAARQFGVHKSTLRHKLRGEHSTVQGDQSRKFSRSDESHFADMLMSLDRVGVPLDFQIREKALELAGLKYKVIPAENGHMSSSWHKGFLRRHPEIASRWHKITHSKSGRKAGKWSVKQCTEWVTLLNELHAYGYLSDPRGLFTVDESRFILLEKTKLKRTSQEIQVVIPDHDGSASEVVTTLFCGRADGLILRPLALFAGVEHLDSHIAEAGDNYCVAYNTSGELDPKIFADYVRKEIFPNMEAQKNIIFVDGYQFSHLDNLELLMECAASDKDMKVVCLPPARPRYRRPLDIGAFGAVKERCRHYLHSASMQLSAAADKQSFALHLVELLNLENKLISGFRDAGIMPFDLGGICKSLKVDEKNVKKVGPVASVIPRVEEPFKVQFANLERSLKEIFTLTPADVKDLMDFVKKKLDAFQRRVFQKPHPTSEIFQLNLKLLKNGL
ncbi:uncharacterized protein LOC129593862 [Paramacrobiotus metropolitanus]|uniref:uncharacterized protein LOC129593862 n=1 Tax=Paramacrobiotus metropolitanus TaxID=2943436 RepID=UPI0024456853|nr:uncharacterized protein LOC129593862 [Paramacrobiotus metropolitanus]